MSKETKALDKWFGEHFEVSFVGGSKKDNKKFAKNLTKQLKEDLKPKKQRRSNKG